MKFVGIFHSHRQLAPISTEIHEKEHFSQICVHFRTDWAHLIDVETGKVLESYYSGNIVIL